jgi:hypothetical protein
LGFFFFFSILRCCSSGHHPISIFSQIWQYSKYESRKSQASFPHCTQLWQSLIFFPKYMEFEIEYSFAQKKVAKWQKFIAKDIMDLIMIICDVKFRI